MSSALTPFDNGEFHLDIEAHAVDGFRVSAEQLARALSTRGRDLVRSIPDAEKGRALVRTPGGEQESWYLTEAGFYRAIGQRQTGRIEDADTRDRVERFQSWAYGDVLPTIRRTGSYGQPVERLTPLEYARSLVAAEERAELAQARAIELEAKVEADRPMVERAKTHATAAGEKTRQQFFREVKQWAHDNLGIEVKQAQVVEFLSTRKLGIFIRGNRSDSGQATASAIERGYAVNREDTALNGHNYVTGKLTARGQEYAWERIFRYIDANGTLELPRQIGGAA